MTKSTNQKAKTWKESVPKIKTAKKTKKQEIT